MNTKLVKLMKPRKALLDNSIGCVVTMVGLYGLVYFFTTTQQIWPMLFASTWGLGYMYMLKKYKAHIKIQNQKGVADA